MLIYLMLQAVIFLALAAALLILVLFWLFVILFVIGWILESYQKRNASSV